MSDKKDLITAQTLADALKLSVETIRCYTRENLIPYIDQPDKQYRYNLADVIQSLCKPTVWENKLSGQSGSYKHYTYQDYLQIPDDPGYRYEILDGVLIKEPSPSVAHQLAAQRLMRILDHYFQQTDPEGHLFFAPLDVTFRDITVVQPDLLFVAGEQKPIIKEARIDGSPTLVAEITSPSTSRKDRHLKMQIYKRAQVQHYWIVDPDLKTLKCFALLHGSYTLAASGMDDDVVKHPDFPGLAVCLNTLWR